MPLDRVAPTSHPNWLRLISGDVYPEFQCLALKLMMIRIRLAYEKDARSAATLVDEVRSFFVNNFRFAAKDHANLFPEYSA